MGTRLVDLATDVEGRVVPAASVPAERGGHRAIVAADAHGRVGDVRWTDGAAPWRPLPPLDLHARADALWLTVPCPPLTAVIEERNSPLGSFTTVVVLDDRGRVEFGPAEGVRASEPDVDLSVDWRRALNLKAGHLDPIGALGDGDSASGDWGALMAVQGLMEDSAWKAYWRLEPADAAFLTAVADAVDATDEWVAWCRAAGAP